LVRPESERLDRAERPDRAEPGERPEPARRGEPRARGRGALEREVLACLAAADRPLSPAEVRAELGDELAYTTVMTTLSRLHAKGAVSRASAGRGYAYALPGGPAQAQASMTAHRMRKLLDGGGDRAGVLARFVADLSDDDERLLADLLADAPRPGAGQEPGAPQEPGAGQEPEAGGDRS
jgi:predicted transcriptional regulator